MSSDKSVVVLNYDIEYDKLNLHIPFLLTTVGLSVCGFNTFTHHFWGKVISRGTCVFLVYIQLKKGGSGSTTITIDTEISNDSMVSVFVADFKKEISHVVDHHALLEKFDIKINSRNLRLVS